MNNHPKGSEPLDLIDAILQDGLVILQDRMAMVDMRSRPTLGRGDALEVLLKEHRLLRLKMDGNLNHARAHLHIDYHRTRHLASYAIDNGELLAGDGTYNGVVQPWIEQHRAELMRVWKGIRTAEVDDAVVGQLKASALKA